MQLGTGRWGRTSQLVCMWLCFGLLEVLLGGGSCTARFVLLLFFLFFVRCSVGLKRGSVCVAFGMLCCVVCDVCDVCVATEQTD